MKSYTRSVTLKGYIEFINESASYKVQWFKAIFDNNFEKIKYLINKGIDINIRKDDNYNTGLMEAAYKKHNSKIFKFLLSQPGIDVNAISKFGYTALMTAMLNDNYDKCKILLRHPDIDPTIKNNGYDFLDEIKDKSMFIDYDMQKDILKNGREDIILFLNKYNVIDPKIKEEYPLLFKTVDWGLI